MIAGRTRHVLANSYRAFSTSSKRHEVLDLATLPSRRVPSYQGESAAIIPWSMMSNARRDSGK